ncbi:MAG: NAD(P)-binding domain-containing protein [Chloroflexi bacterium]|nr:NAD(P)-binding domain-containing protein [Chloroflexota bacterium]
MSGSLRFLSADDVTACLPSVEERLMLAERSMVALVADAELPPKIGVHPRPAGSFAHAMPASLRPLHGAPGGDDDLLGMKWVTGFGGDRAKGIPAIHALVILSDPSTGVPRAILDGGPITAHRTAAISGLAISRFAASPPSSGEPSRRMVVRAALIGAGVQGHSHLAMLGHVLPGVELVVHDRHPERAAELAALAGRTAGIGAARTARRLADATKGADVVVTAVSFTDAAQRGELIPESLAPEALVVAIDYATMVAPSVARQAALFVVDDRGQFQAGRDGGLFDGYPDPAMTLGEAILAGVGRPRSGRMMVSHLGVGLADLVFADAILRRAEAVGLGTLLRT